MVASAAICGGCDAPEELAGELEQTLREHATTERKAGTLRALQSAKTAREVAERVASSADPGCALHFPRTGGFTYEFTLELTRRSAAGVDQRWTETRILRRDDDGDVALEMAADAATEVGVGVHRTPQWLIVGDESFVSVDGRAFYRRPSGPLERERLLEAGQTTLQTLLDAVPSGWRKVDEDGQTRFEVGGEETVCGPRSASDAGWLRRFETRATPISGALRAVDGSRRALQIRWQLEDGTTLQATFDDRLVRGAESIEAPDASAIVSVRRDRSLEAVEQMLTDMTEAGLVDRPDSTTTTDSKDTEP